jgi:hypothetical protein
MAAAVPFKAIKAETKNKIIKDESRYVKLARKLSNIANRLSEDGKLATSVAPVMREAM